MMKPATAVLRTEFDSLTGCRFGVLITEAWRPEFMYGRDAVIMRPHKIDIPFTCTDKEACYTDIVMVYGKELLRFAAKEGLVYLMAEHLEGDVHLIGEQRTLE